MYLVVFDEIENLFLASDYVPPHECVAAMNRAGSIPVVPALASEGAPVILTGIGLPDDRLHAPNEKLELKQLWEGIEVFRRFYELLGAQRHM